MPSLMDFKKLDGCASVREIHRRFVYVLQSVGLSNHYSNHVDPRPIVSAKKRVRGTRGGVSGETER